MTDKKKKTSKVKKPVMTAPKNDAQQAVEPVQADAGGDVRPRWSAWVEQAIFWLLVWALIFGAVGFIARCCRYGWPSISISWELSPTKSSLGRWVLSERPALLKADYPAVGAELAETARRLRDGRFGGANDALADTIARVQPAVSDPAAWRLFLTRFGGEIEGGDFSKLADQYEEAAGLFGIKAVQTILSANGCSDDAVGTVAAGPPGEVIDDEKVADEIDPPVGDSPGPLGDERPDEGENIEGDGGENSGPVSGDEGESGPGTETGNSSGAGQCPTGTCPAVASPQGSYRPSASSGWGWPGWWW